MPTNRSSSAGRIGLVALAAACLYASADRVWVEGDRIRFGSSALGVQVDVAPWIATVVLLLSAVAGAFAIWYNRRHLYLCSVWSGLAVCLLALSLFYPLKGRALADLASWVYAWKDVVQATARVTLCIAASIVVAWLVGSKDAAVRSLWQRLLAHDSRVVAACTLVATALPAYIALFSWQQNPVTFDGVAYLAEGRLFWAGQLGFAPPDVDFFETWVYAFPGKNGLMNIGFPPAWPALLGLADVVDCAWLVSPFLVGLTVVVVHRVGLELYDRRTALIAAGLLSASTWPAIMGSLHLSHAAAALLVSIALLGGAACLRSRHPGWGLATGSAVGMLTLVRMLDGLFVLLTLAMLLVIAIWQDRPQFGRALWVRFAAAMVLAGLPWLVTLLLYNAATTGHPLIPGHLAASGAMGLPAAVAGRIGEVVPAGSSTVDLAGRTHGVRQVIETMNINLYGLQGSMLGWAVPSATLVLLLFLLRAPTVCDLVLGAVALGVVVGYGFVTQTTVTLGPRYLYAALPALLLLTSRALIATAQMLDRRWRHGTIAIAVFCVASTLHAHSHLPGFVRWFGRTYGEWFVTDLKRVSERVEGRAIVFVGGEPTGQEENFHLQVYATAFLLNLPRFDGRILYVRDLGPRNAELLARYPDRHGFRYQFNPQRGIGQLERQ